MTQFEFVRIPSLAVACMLVLAGGCGTQDGDDTPVDVGCPDGAAVCGGECVDLQSNSDHCGECQNSCPAGVPLCRSGTCGCIESDQTPCNDQCVDRSTNDRHCGTCGNACPSGQTCEEGSCRQLTVVESTIQHTNRVRSSQTDCGRHGIQQSAAPLTGHPELHRAAQMHAESMARNQFFSHTYPPPDCDPERDAGCHDFAWRIGQTDYTGRPVGENIARGQSSPATVVEGWRESDGHCKNMMNPGATEIGIGFAEGNGGPFWVQVFGRQ